MQALMKYRSLLRTLSSLTVGENINRNALGVVCSNYHAVVNNQSLIDCKRYQLHNPITLNNVRFKSKKKQRSQTEIYSDDEEEQKEEGHDEILGKGVEVKTVKAQSLRIDQLFKQAFNTSRGKLETAFFENRFRINGENVKKKAAAAQIGDEVDLIKGLSKGSQDLLEVNRIEILSCKPNETMDGIFIKLRKSKSLIVENYPPPHSWRQAEKEESQS